jgi:hypothetical protein
MSRVLQESREQRAESREAREQRSREKSAREQRKRGTLAVGGGRVVERKEKLNHLFIRGLIRIVLDVQHL